MFFLENFSIHGFEDSYYRDGSELTYIADEFYSYMKQNMPIDLIDKWTIYILPASNPDGQHNGWTNKNFLSFILDNEYYDSVISYIDDIDEGKEGIKLLADDEKYDEDRKSFGLLIEEGRKELLDLFNEYSSRNPDGETFTEAIAAIKSYREELDRVLGKRDDS